MSTPKLNCSDDPSGYGSHSIPQKWDIFNVRHKVDNSLFKVQRTVL